MKDDLVFVKEELEGFLIAHPVIEKLKKEGGQTFHNLIAEESSHRIDSKTDAFDRSRYVPINLQDIVWMAWNEIKTEGHANEPEITLVCRKLKEYVEKKIYSTELLRTENMQPSYYYSNTVKGGKWSKKTIQNKISAFRTGQLTFVGKIKG